MAGLRWVNRSHATSECAGTMGSMGSQGVVGLVSVIGDGTGHIHDEFPVSAELGVYIQR